jgi:dipeptide/tripeptide permease
MAEQRSSLADYVRGFNRPFWAANASELFERVAYYGMAPVLVPYLVQVRHFDESAAIRVGGNLGFIVYGLTVLSGMFVDWLGYRRAMMLAYVLLAAGYAGVWKAPTFPVVVLALTLVAIGASLIKPAIAGTVQRTCTEERRPVGFSIYYTVVNVGGFLGPNLSGAIATAAGLALVFPACSLVILIALAMILLFYTDPGGPDDAPKRKLGEFVTDFLRILTTARLMTLFVLIAGFWSLFFQFFGAFTTYLTQDLGLTQQRANFIISLDAFLIIFTQVIVGYLVRNWTTSRAVWIAAFIGAAGYGVIGLGMSPWLAGAGVVIFSIGEMIYSAHFYKYLGSLAPPGQEGMYLGFAFLPIALGSLLSGWIGGPIATWARTTLQHPEKMFWGFGAVGLIAAIGLWLHARVYAAGEART